MLSLPASAPPQLLHPIFFDDNIHNDAEDSIVSVRVSERPGDAYRPISGEAIRRLQGIALVRVPTLEPVLHRGWFLGRIQDAERRLDRDFYSPEQQAAILSA